MKQISLFLFLFLFSCSAQQYTVYGVSHKNESGTKTTYFQSHSQAKAKKILTLLNTLQERKEIKIKEFFYMEVSE